MELKAWNTHSQVCLEDYLLKILKGWVVVKCSLYPNGKHLHAGDGGLRLFKGEDSVIKAVTDSEIELKPVEDKHE